MTTQKNEISLLFPLRIRIGERIYREGGTYESIYGIEYGFGKVKYVSTIDIFDRGFEILKTYELNKYEIKLVAEMKRLIPNNLERAKLKDIEEVEWGLSVN